MFSKQDGKDEREKEDRKVSRFGKMTIKPFSVSVAKEFVCLLTDSIPDRYLRPRCGEGEEKRQGKEIRQRPSSALKFSYITIQASRKP
jgi:hypothetical protein